MVLFGRGEVCSYSRGLFRCLVFRFEERIAADIAVKAESFKNRGKYDMGKVTSSLCFRVAMISNVMLSRGFFQKVLYNLLFLRGS